jgi:hypothetical protein
MAKTNCNAVEWVTFDLYHLGTGMSILPLQWESFEYIYIHTHTYIYTYTHNLGVAVPPEIRDSVSHSRAEVAQLYVSLMMMTARLAAIF